MIVPTSLFGDCVVGILSDGTLTEAHQTLAFIKRIDYDEVKKGFESSGGSDVPSEGTKGNHNIAF